MLKPQSFRAVAVAIAFACSAIVCSSQVKTGIPPFRSFGGGPDVINLGNLNMHYSIPVFSRAGRGGMSFSYAFAYDNRVWTPLNGTSWIASGGGLTKDVAAAVGFVPVTITQGHCIDHDNGNTVYYTRYGFSSFTDSAGTKHPFTGATIVDDNFCTGGAEFATRAMTDGSGMSIYLESQGGPPYATVTLPSGQTLDPPVSGGAAGGTQTDTNGNKITTSVTNGITSFYDTLSTTVPVLTIDPTDPMNVKYTYTSPANTDASITVSYKTYPIQTDFACSGISEYGPVNSSLPDKITLPDGSFYQFTYEATPTTPTPPPPGITAGAVTGRLASLTLPTGGMISYNYSGGSNGILCADGTTSGFTRTTPDGTWQYSRTGTAPAYTTTITSPPDPLTSQTNQTKIQFQGDFETQRDVYSGAVGSGTPLQTVITCYNGNGVTNPSSCTTTAVVTPFNQITRLTSLNGGSRARVDNFYNGNGQVTETDGYDFGASVPTRKTATIYAALGGILNHPASITVTDGANNLKAKTTYSYDEGTLQTSGITTNHVSVTGPRGNLTTITVNSSSTATLARTSRYYDTGTTYTSTDVNNAMTTYSYGACAGAFPTTVTLPITGLSRSMTWNCTGGVRTSTTDENGKISYINYTTDTNFWRPESTKDPLLNVTNLTYPTLVKSEGYLNFNGTTSTVDGLKQLDSLGRSQYTQQKQSQTAANYDTVQQVYDSFGRPYKVTMPYVATSASPGPPAGTPIASTTYYDALGRPIQTLDGSGGQLNVTYSGRDVYQEVAPKPGSDSNTKRKQLEYDALGRLLSVCEITGGPNSGPCGQDTVRTGYRTAYIYDTAPNVNSLTVTQNAQSGGGTSQTRTYIYDMLGRLTQETNPETVTTNYVYDSDTTCTGGYPAGNMVKRTDAVGNVTCYTYDQLHRLLSVTYPSGSYATNTDKKYFVYDAATVGGATMQNPKGRLAEAYTCPATGACTTKKTDLGFSYSARGEVAVVYEKTPNSGATYYQVSASYWAHGGINSLSSNLTGVPTITYGASDGSGIDGEGRITKVTASTGQSPLVSAVTYTNSGTTQPIGSLTQVTFGSSDYDTFSYDPNTGRLNQYKFYVGATPQTVTGNLNWNPNGSLGSLAITDQLNSANTQTCNYSHDDLGRIASANCGALWNQSFLFDPFGNITKNATAGISFTPTYNLGTNQYSTVPSCTPAPSYDANGFATWDCAHSYSWDSAGNPRTIDTVNLTYDALGRMVEQARGSTYTQIVYGPGGGKLALMNGQTLVRAFVLLPGGAAAVYTSTGLTYYRHADWLGSGRLATTPTRALYFDVAYGPYGESYAGTGSVDLNFTGQNQDTVSGLYDFLFREYNANHGRWPWPDPAGLGAVSMGNPQTWNRYAYVGNSPLDATDPLGLWGSDVFGTGRWGFLDGLRDPGGAWFYALTQGWKIAFSPMQQGLTQYLGSIPQNWQYVSGTMVQSQITGWATLDGSGSGIMNDSGAGSASLGYWDFVPLGGNSSWNFAPGPNATIGPPQEWHPAQQKSALNKYLTQYVPCAVGEGINKFWGDSGKAGATVVAHITPLAARNLQKGGPYVALLFTAAYDISSALSVRQQCTAEVYGGER